MRDRAELLDRVQRGLGREYRGNPELINTPGRSLLLRLDPFYYIAPSEAFLLRAGRWGLLLPERVRELLIRSGDLVSHSRDRSYALKLRLLLRVGGEPRPATLEACLLHSTFVDRALTLYGGLREPPPVALVLLAATERPKLAAFLEGKTMLADAAFAA